MRRRHLGLALTLLGGALPQIGCQSFNTPQARPATQAIMFEKPLDAPHGSREAAQTCLFTAETYDRAGKEVEAIQGYEMARQQNPRLSNHVSRRLAVLYDRQGDVAKATAEYTRALKAYPKDSDLFNDYGYFLYLQGRYPEAELALQKAVELNANNRRAVVNRGMAIAQQGRYEDAFNVFAGAVGQAEAHANLGYVYSTQGKRDEAIKSYRTALSLNPELKQAQVALDVLSKPKLDAFSSARPSESGRPGDFKEPPAFAPAGIGMRDSVNRPPLRERPSEVKNRNPEEIFQRLSNFRREQEEADAIQAARQTEPPPPEEPAKPKSALYDPAAEREAAPAEPKRFVPSVRPITIPAPRDSGNAQN